MSSSNTWYSKPFVVSVVDMRRAQEKKLGSCLMSLLICNEQVELKVRGKQRRNAFPPFNLVLSNEVSLSFDFDENADVYVITGDGRKLYSIFFDNEQDITTFQRELEQSLGPKPVKAENQRESDSSTSEISESEASGADDEDTPKEEEAPYTPEDEFEKAARDRKKNWEKAKSGFVQSTKKKERCDKEFDNHFKNYADCDSAEEKELQEAEKHAQKAKAAQKDMIKHQEKAELHTKIAAEQRRKKRGHHKSLKNLAGEAMENQNDVLTDLENLIRGGEDPTSLYHSPYTGPITPVPFDPHGEVSSRKSRHSATSATADPSSSSLQSSRSRKHKSRNPSSMSYPSSVSVSTEPKSRKHLSRNSSPSHAARSCGTISKSSRSRSVLFSKSGSSSKSSRSRSVSALASDPSSNSLASAKPKSSQPKSSQSEDELEDELWERVVEVIAEKTCLLDGSEPDYDRLDLNLLKRGTKSSTDNKNEMVLLAKRIARMFKKNSHVKSLEKWKVDPSTLAFMVPATNYLKSVMEYIAANGYMPNPPAGRAGGRDADIWSDDED